jgi:hypothetical protein
MQLVNIMGGLRLPPNSSLNEWVDWVMEVVFRVPPANLATSIDEGLQVGTVLSQLVANTALRVLVEGF